MCTSGLKRLGMWATNTDTDNRCWRTQREDRKVLWTHSGRLMFTSRPQQGPRHAQVLHMNAGQTRRGSQSLSSRGKKKRCMNFPGLYTKSVASTKRNKLMLPGSCKHNNCLLPNKKKKINTVHVCLLLTEKHTEWCLPAGDKKYIQAIWIRISCKTLKTINILIPSNIKCLKK